MKKKIAFAVVLTILVAACIHVVVNVYFPEAEAQGALATLEDELLTNQATPDTKQDVQPQAPAEKNEEATPKKKALNESMVVGLSESFNVYAADKITERELYNKIRSMPQVVAAYERINARLPRVNALRSAGKVGEGNDGLLHPRASSLDRRAQRTMEEDNQDRRVVIKGLARAILLAQGLAANRENLNSVMDRSAKTFAALRRSTALSGWWIQKADGTWKKKGSKG